MSDDHYEPKTIWGHIYRWVMIVVLLALMAGIVVVAYGPIGSTFWDRLALLAPPALFLFAREFWFRWRNGYWR